MIAYRMLGDHELVQDGDELRLEDPNAEIPEGVIGRSIRRPVSSPVEALAKLGHSWHRPTELPQGYRLVNSDEAIQAGDKFGGGFDCWTLIASDDPAVGVRLEEWQKKHPLARALLFVTRDENAPVRKMDKLVRGKRYRRLYEGELIIRGDLCVADHEIWSTLNAGLVVSKKHDGIRHYREVVQ